MKLLEEELTWELEQCYRNDAEALENVLNNKAGDIEDSRGLV